MIQKDYFYLQFYMNVRQIVDLKYLSWIGIFHCLDFEL